MDRRPYILKLLMVRRLNPKNTRGVSMSTQGVYSTEKFLLFFLIFFMSLFLSFARRSKEWEKRAQEEKRRQKDIDSTSDSVAESFCVSSLFEREIGWIRDTRQEKRRAKECRQKPFYFDTRLVRCV